MSNELLFSLLALFCLIATVYELFRSSYVAIKYREAIRRCQSYQELMKLGVGGKVANITSTRYCLTWDYRKIVQWEQERYESTSQFTNL